MKNTTQNKILDTISLDKEHQNSIHIMDPAYTGWGSLSGTYFLDIIT